jgi:glycosyl hydrolase family 71
MVDAIGLDLVMIISLRHKHRGHVKRAEQAAAWRPFLPLILLTLALAAALFWQPAAAEDLSLPQPSFFMQGAAARPEKRVFAHYMLCCGSFGRGMAAAERDIRLAQEMGLDGFALNAGAWSREPYYQQSAAAMFEAAERLGTGFALFFSADMCCSLNADDIRDMVTTYGTRPNYFRKDGRIVLSTFAGERAGDAFWRNEVLTPLREAGLAVFFVPAFYPVTTSGRAADEVGRWGDLVDGLFRFNPDATPFGTSSSVATNEAYARALAAAGKLFLAGYSPFYWGARQSSAGRRYFEYRGGLGTERQWRSIIAVQDPSWVEIVTWNDPHESYLIAPVDDPDGFHKPHLAFAELNRYFIAWFKSGVRPVITKDALFYFYRTHGKSLASPEDPLGPVTRLYGDPEDAIYVTTALTAPAELRVESGGAKSEHRLEPGLSHIAVPFEAGAQHFELWRDGQRLSMIDGEPVAPSISRYNFFYTTGFVESDP